MPVGTIEIQGPPGSQVAVDGTDHGTTDAQGRLVLPDLPVGAHRLVVNKPGYRPGDFKLTLAAREYKHLPVQLDWAGGFLTVRSEPPGASVEIAGLGQFKDGVSELQCPPGSYDITVARAGMKSETRSVAVVAGQHAAIEIHLMPDPQYFQEKLADARQHLSHGDAQGAIQISSELSSLEPNNPDVQSVLAAAYWRTHDPGHFESAAADAIRNGGSVTLNLAHEHFGTLGGSDSSSNVDHYGQIDCLRPGRCFLQVSRLRCASGERCNAGSDEQERGRFHGGAPSCTRNVSSPLGFP
jgi:hypothetical protein